MLDVTHIIEAGGILLIAAIIFSESGLLVGFFLPGDTLLFTAGFFASQGKLPLPLLLIALVVAATLGFYTGYLIGNKTGSKIFRKKDGILFRQEYVEQAEAFYEKHGGKTIMFARFVPIIRTLAPLLAGVAKMPLPRFMLYNIIGGTIWTAGITLLGFWLGSKIPNIDHYLLPIIGLAVLFTFGPTAAHILRDPRTRRQLAARLRGQR